jgi:hypothetical protein
MHTEQQQAAVVLGDRFWSKVDRTGGPDACWLWTAAKRTAGYGVYGIGSTNLYQAHRLSYEESFGAVPHGLILDHVCRVRACVNPAHLRPITKGDNQQNQSRYGRKSASGIRGVHKHKDGWSVCVKVNGVRHRAFCTSLAEADATARDLRMKFFTYNNADRTEEDQ